MDSHFNQHATSIPQTQYIYFTWEGESDGDQNIFGFPASELTSIATLCPFGRFPGLPKGVVGLVLWGGALLPVLDLSPVFGSQYVRRLEAALSMGRATFLFTKAGGNSDRTEFVIALPGTVQLRANSQVNIQNLKIDDIRQLQRNSNAA